MTDTLQSGVARHYLSASSTSFAIVQFRWSLVLTITCLDIVLLFITHKLK